MVSDTRRLPLAVYGKPDASADAGGYRFLVRHPAFDPPPIDRALRRLVGALEWKASPRHHVPVFGYLVVDAETSLVARFLDTGRDASGRPHTLRVECVLWDHGQITSTILVPEVWTAVPESPRAELIVCRALDDERPLPQPKSPGTIILLGDATHFSHISSAKVAEFSGTSIDGSPTDNDT